MADLDDLNKQLQAFKRNEAIKSKAYNFNEDDHYKKVSHYLLNIFDEQMEGVIFFFEENEMEIKIKKFPVTEKKEAKIISMLLFNESKEMGIIELNHNLIMPPRNVMAKSIKSGGGMNKSSSDSKPIFLPLKDIYFTIEQLIGNNIWPDYFTQALKIASS